MAVPTTYTEAEFKAYLHGEISEIAAALGWTVAGGSYDEVVNDALLLLGVTDIASASGATSIYRLRKLGQLSAWKRVLNATAGDCDFSADTSSFSRSQVFSQAKARVSALESETAAYRTDYAAEVSTLDDIHNPYQERLLEDRTL